MADESPEAFAKVVDRLLASPHYGERWGRHWLDVARYGEDQAHTFQARMYPNGFKYRDWVVKALNADMPYDRFIVEQVAGDLIDEPGVEIDRLAGCSGSSAALGPVYYGGRGLRRAGTTGSTPPDPRLPGPDGRLRPVSRPQVRPDPHIRLLLAGRDLLEHRLQGIPGRPVRDGRRLRKSPGRDQGEDGRECRLPQGRVEALDRLGGRLGFRQVHGRGLDPGQPPESETGPLDGRGRQGRGARSPLPRPLDQVPRTEGRRQAPLPRPLAKAGRRPGPQGRPFGR